MKNNIPPLKFFTVGKQSYSLNLSDRSVYRRELTLFKLPALKCPTIKR